MKQVEPETEVCFKRYSKAMKEIQANTPPTDINVDEKDLVSYQKKKREAADEGIKSVCWWVFIDWKLPYLNGFWIIRRIIL